MSDEFDLPALVGGHCDLFNECFREGDWAPFVATFADDARMAFTNVPVGPFNGRDAIGRAYAANPPSDTMSVVSVEPLDACTARVRFEWDAGGPGTMVVHWRGDPEGRPQVAALEITFG
jgi:steroid Delta-isomerase